MEQDDQVDHDGDHGSDQQLQSTVCTRVVSKFHFVDLAGPWNNTITITSQMPHQVKDFEFIQMLVCHRLPSSSSSVDLYQQDVASECHCLQVSLFALHIMLGTYNLAWNR